MTKKNIGIIIITALLLIPACSTFIRDEVSESITLKYQAGEFVMLQDLKRNDSVLPANSAVKLIVITGDEWIKIYAYDAKEDLLSSKRILLLYLFESDFPEEKFSQEFLDNELLKLVKPNVSGGKAEKKKQKK